MNMNESLLEYASFLNNVSKNIWSSVNIDEIRINERKNTVLHHVCYLWWSFEPSACSVEIVRKE